MQIKNRKINIDDLVIYQDINLDDYGQQDYVIYPNIYETSSEEALAFTIDANAVDDLTEQLFHVCDNEEEAERLHDFIQSHVNEIAEYKKLTSQ